MILGSHNSWSYLPLKKRWMKPFGFIAKCQNVDIETLYEDYNVRCFDLRVKFKKDGQLIVAHGAAEYDINEETLLKQLDWLNSKGDVYLRVIHEIRKDHERNLKTLLMFRLFCAFLEQRFPNLKLWCGRNLVNWSIEYLFTNNPSCKELYSSVCVPRVIDDWWPWLYAKIHNKRNRVKEYREDILLIDFVDIGV